MDLEKTRRYCVGGFCHLSGVLWSGLCVTMAVFARLSCWLFSLVCVLFRCVWFHLSTLKVKNGGNAKPQVVLEGWDLSLNGYDVKRNMSMASGSVIEFHDSKDLVGLVREGSDADLFFGFEENDYEGDTIHVNEEDFHSLFNNNAKKHIEGGDDGNGAKKHIEGGDDGNGDGDPAESDPLYHGSLIHGVDMEIDSNKSCDGHLFTSDDDEDDQEEDSFHVEDEESKEHEELSFHFFQHGVQLSRFQEPSSKDLVRFNDAKRDLFLDEEISCKDEEQEKGFLFSEFCNEPSKGLLFNELGNDNSCKNEEGMVNNEPKFGNEEALLVNENGKNQEVFLGNVTCNEETIIHDVNVVKNEHPIIEEVEVEKNEESIVKGVPLEKNEESFIDEVKLEKNENAIVDEVKLEKKKEAFIDEVKVEENDEHTFDEDGCPYDDEGFEEKEYGNEYEDEDDDDEEHDFFIQRLKSEIRRLKGPNLSVIPEECESDLAELSGADEEGKQKQKNKVDPPLVKRVEPPMEEPLEIFYEKYAERMRAFDVLNFQQMYTLGILQIKNSGKTPKTKSPGVVSRLKRSISGKAEVSDSSAESVRRLHQDLEAVYVGQACLSWETLHWQYKKLRDMAASGADQAELFSACIADQFQQFQVLLERFLENEQFEGPRVLNYVKTRCVQRRLLQVPCISGAGSVKAEVNTITVAKMITIIERSMSLFWDYVRADKQKTTGQSQVFNFLCTGAAVEDKDDFPLFHSIRRNLHFKESRVQDLQKRGKCLMKKLDPNIRGEGLEILMALVDLKLIARVLKMTRITSDQLQWCEKKLSKITARRTKVIRAGGTVLFPY